MEIKELILRCIDNVISARCQNIRSGWKSIFTVFSFAAPSPEESISNFAFDILDQLFRNNFELLVFDFTDLVNCFLSFAEGQHLYISLGAIRHLQRAGSLLAQGALTYKMVQKQNSLEASDGVGDGSVGEDSRSESGNGILSPSGGNQVQGSISEGQLQLWWPLLVGLAARVADFRLPVRTAALEALMITLREHGDIFAAQTWKLVFRYCSFAV